MWCIPPRPAGESVTLKQDQDPGFRGDLWSWCPRHRTRHQQVPSGLGESSHAASTLGPRASKGRSEVDIAKVLAGCQDGVRNALGVGMGEGALS